MVISRAPKRPYGPNADARFTLHQRQPRADKLDARQRRLCKTDPPFAAALEKRVANPARFYAFMARLPSYVDVDRPCPKCKSIKRRTRDRSCYTCHLARSGENFERIRAGLAPVAQRSNASHLDLIERKKAERNGEYVTRQFGSMTVRSWPLGRLDLVLPDGREVANFEKLTWQECKRAVDMFPDLKDALRWAGWSVD
jgi:hypothetical protein